MASETRKAEITELVQSEVIDPLIMKAAENRAALFPYLRWKELSGASQVAFPRESLAAASGTATTGVSETSEITASTFETTETTIAPSKIAIRRDVTAEALEDNVKRGELLDFIVDSNAREIAKTFDHTVCDLMPSFSNSVGSSTLDTAEMAAAVAQISENGMNPGPASLVFALHPKQWSDLLSDYVTNTSTTVMSFMSLVNDGSNVKAKFMDNDVVVAGNIDQVGSNRVGACFIRGDRDPYQAAIGAVSARATKTAVDYQVNYDEHWVVTTARYGAGILSDESGCKISTTA